MEESERAVERRRNTYAEHEVVDYVEREHSMNGKKCEHPWAVMRFKYTGSVAFYCGECRVGCSSGPSYDELMELTDVTENTNPNSKRYPTKLHIPSAFSHNRDYVHHVPPERMG